MFHLNWPELFLCFLPNFKVWNIFSLLSTLSSPHNCTTWKQFLPFVVLFVFCGNCFRQEKIFSCLLPRWIKLGNHGTSSASSDEKDDIYDHPINRKIRTGDDHETMGPRRKLFKVFFNFASHVDVNIFVEEHFLPQYSNTLPTVTRPALDQLQRREF